MQWPRIDKPEHQVRWVRQLIRISLNNSTLFEQLANLNVGDEPRDHLFERVIAEMEVIKGHLAVRQGSMNLRARAIAGAA